MAALNRRGPESRLLHFMSCKSKIQFWHTMSLALVLRAPSMVFPYMPVTVRPSFLAACDFAAGNRRRNHTQSAAEVYDHACAHRSHYQIYKERDCNAIPTENLNFDIEHHLI